MNTGAAVVGGLVGLGVGWAVASSRKKPSSSSAPALTCGPSEAARWVLQKGIVAVVVSTPEYLEGVPSNIRYAIVQSNCSVYVPQQAAPGFGIDAALTAEFQAFLHSSSGAPVPPPAEFTPDPSDEPAMPPQSTEALGLGEAYVATTLFHWYVPWYAPSRGRWIQTVQWETIVCSPPPRDLAGRPCQFPLNKLSAEQREFIEDQPTHSIHVVFWIWNQQSQRWDYSHAELYK